jgi:hypothetical protein
MGLSRRPCREARQQASAPKRGDHAVGDFVLHREDIAAGAIPSVRPKARARAADVQRIARDLNVRYVLTGAIQREGDRQRRNLAGRSRVRSAPGQRHPHEIQLIVDEAPDAAALVTPIAPTKMRLSAQTTSRLNQLFEMNFNPSHS